MQTQERQELNSMFTVQRVVYTVCSCMTLPEANLFAEIASRLYMYHVELCITFVNSSPMYTHVHSSIPVYILKETCV